MDGWVIHSVCTLLVASAIIVTVSDGHTVEISADINPGDCGHFKKVKKGDSGSIKSPNYPSHYPNKARCIWLLEAPIDWKFEVTIDEMNGESGSGVNASCRDYVEVRSGSATERRDYYECETATAQSFRTNSRWMWIKFESDGTVNNTGFKARWMLKADKGNADDPSPVPDCRPSGQGVAFECANKECVPWSYVCDHENDCGCTGDGCDESRALCRGLGLSEGVLVGVGIALGFAIFVPIFLGIGFVDIYLKKKAEKDLDKKIKEAKLRDKQKKFGALVATSIPAGPSRPTTAKK